MLGNTSNSLRTDDCTNSLPLAQLAAERGVGELEQYAGYWSLCTKYLPIALLCRWIKCWKTRVVRKRKVTDYLIMHARASSFLQLDKVLGNSSNTLGIDDCALRLSFSSPILAAGRGAGGGLWTQDGGGGGPEAVRGGPWRGHPVSFAGRHSQHTTLSLHPEAHQVGSTGRCNCNLKQSEAYSARVESTNKRS